MPSDSLESFLLEYIEILGYPLSLLIIRYLVIECVIALEGGLFPHVLGNLKLIMNLE